MPLSQRHVCVPAADGDAAQPVPEGCATACPINQNDNAKVQNPACTTLLMPASMGVRGTFQGNIDTVPYHIRRRPKSAELGAILSRGFFQTRRDQLSVSAPCRVSIRHVMRSMWASPSRVASEESAQRFVDPAALKITKRPWLEAS